MSKGIRRPPFDPELELVLEAMAEQLPPTITPETILPMRHAMSQGQDATQSLAEHGLQVREVTVASYDGTAIALQVIRPRGHTGTGPGFYYIHGGGMMFGDALGGVEVLADWLVRYDAVAVSVDYRLAPGHPDPTPVEDCYARLLWTADHAQELGIDPALLIIAGSSAGGGLAAGTTRSPVIAVAPPCRASC